MFKAHEQILKQRDEIYELKIVSKTQHDLGWYRHERIG